MIWDERIDENLRNVDAYIGGKIEGIEANRNDFKSIS